MGISCNKSNTNECDQCGACSDVQDTDIVCECCGWKINTDEKHYLLSFPNASYYYCTNEECKEALIDELRA
jgi:hypothetical protein